MPWELIVGLIITLISILFYTWLKKSNQELNDYYPFHYNTFYPKKKE